MLFTADDVLSAPALTDILTARESCGARAEVAHPHCARPQETARHSAPARFDAPAPASWHHALALDLSWRTFCGGRLVVNAQITR